MAPYSNCQKNAKSAKLHLFVEYFAVYGNVCDNEEVKHTKVQPTATVLQYTHGRI